MVEDTGTLDTKSDPAVKVGVATALPPAPAVSRVVVRTIAGLSARVQSYTQDQAVDRVRALIDQVHATYFELGGTLQRIRTEKWYSPHKTFKAYLSDLGLPYRRANYFMTIFAVMTREGIEWSRFAHLGWTKMVCLTEVITAENAETWLETAAANSRGQLQTIVNEQLAKVRHGRSGSAVRSSSRRDEMLTSSPLVASPVSRSRLPVAAAADAEASERAELSSRLSALELRAFSSIVSEVLTGRDENAVRFVIRVLARRRGLSVNFG